MTLERLSATVFAAFAACVANIVSLRAADILNEGFPYSVAIVGKIESGDYDKLRKELENGSATSIHIASTGGNVAEAIKIGRLIRALNIKTVIPAKYSKEVRDSLARIIAQLFPRRYYATKNAKDNYMCASACFFIFVSGIEKSFDWSGLEDEPILGIHRPFMPDSDLKRFNANQAMASAKTLRTLVETYLKEMDVPAKYSDLMFSTPSSQMRWITTSEFRDDFEGFVPSLRDWMNAKCDSRTDIEKLAQQMLGNKSHVQMTDKERQLSDLLAKKYVEKIRCESAAHDGLIREAHEKIWPPNVIMPSIARCIVNPESCKEQPK